MKEQIYFMIKMVVGVVASIVIATQIGLDYALSAGIIVMLSMLQTRKQTLQVGLKRVITAFIAIGLSSFLFHFLGFNILVFALFLMIFTPLTVILKAEVGLVVNTVLVTHLLADGKITAMAMGNEVLLMLIGVTIANLMNLHMPNHENELKVLVLEVEDRIKSILRKMGLQLVNQCQVDEQQVSLEELKSLIDEGQAKAYRYMNNTYFKDNSYYASYFTMRKAQYRRLMDMERYFVQVVVTLDEAELLKDFTMQLAQELSESNSGDALLERLEVLKNHYKSRDLPKTREAFENRAMLYQYLKDIENFIKLKADFVKSTF